MAKTWLFIIYFIGFTAGVSILVAQPMLDQPMLDQPIFDQPIFDQPIFAQPGQPTPNFTRITNTTQNQADSLLQSYQTYLAGLPAPDTTGSAAWIDNLLSSMTLEEKIGQMLMLSTNTRRYRGVSDPAMLIEKYHLGGFLVPRNMDPYRMQNLTNRLNANTRIPLLFAADYERGAGHYSNTFTELPSNMALGAANDTELARLSGAVTAIESRAIGVNMLLAPVVDVNNNADNPIINTRSYGENPVLVSRMASAFLAGAASQGVLTTLKHFPGHGNTSVDSHTALPVVEGSWVSLDSLELYPYGMLLETRQPAAVMTGHLMVPEVDTVPATFSTRLLNQWLRNKHNFNGLIITDDIEMGALRRNYRVEERIIRPIEAGTDILLLPKDPNEAIEIILGAIESGRLSEARIDVSVRRILAAKAKIGLHNKRFASAQTLGELASVSRGKDLEAAIAHQAVTVLRGDPRISDNADVLLVQLSNKRRAGSIETAMKRLSNAINPTWATEVPRRPSRRYRRTLNQQAQDADEIILVLYLRIQTNRGNVLLDDAQSRVVQTLIDAGRPVTLVTMGNPYAIENFPNAKDVIILYDQTWASIDALSDVLLGRHQARGTLPVTLRKTSNP